MTPLSPRHLAVADYAGLAAYFGACLGIGFLCRRKGRDEVGFFLGDRSVPWWAAAISFFATATSSISLMALPARTFASNWLSFGSAPAQSLAGILVGLVFSRLLRRMNLVTVYGYLEQRFGRTVRLLGGGLAALLKVFARMSVIMLLPALALSTVTGLGSTASILLLGAITTVYATEGGFAAVVWTDLVQVLVTYGGVGVSVIYALKEMPGGVIGVLHEAQASGKLAVLDRSPSLSAPTVWVFAGMFLGHVFTQLADQPLMQRMLATRDESQAQRTMIWGNALSLLSSVLFFSVGTILYVFYRHHPARLAPAVPADAIFPYFIANELPAGAVGLIIASFFAASMGSLSSTMNATAAVVVNDLYPSIDPAAPEPRKVRLAKLVTVTSGCLATGMALWLARRGIPSLWDEFLKLVALIGGGFPGVFALGLLTRRANSAGAILGTIASIGITYWVQTRTTISVFLDGFVAIGSCFVIGYLASRLVDALKARSVRPAAGQPAGQNSSPLSRLLVP